MALTLTLYSFSKRKNSTAIPSGGTSFSITLKQETSLDNPVFYLNADDLSGYNYAAFNGAYYWIRDIRSVRDNLWEVECAIDVLATCRTQILATSAYVEYCTNGNTDMIDARIGVEYDTTTAVESREYTYISPNVGAYFLSVVGQDSCDTFIVSQTTMKSIMNNATQWSTNIIDDTSVETALKTIFTQTLAQGSAADCIKAAYWLPIDGSAVSGTAQTITLGNFQTNYSGKNISDRIIVETVTVPINHTYSDWRKCQPYTMVYLTIPFYGVVEVPSDIAANNTGITARMSINVLSGDFTFSLRGNNEFEYFMQCGGNIYSPVLIGASNINAPISAGGLITTGVAAALGNITGVVAGVAATLAGVSPVPTASGSIGGSSNLNNHIGCLVRTRATSDTPTAGNAVQGLPYFKTAVIGQRSGYVQTKGFSLQGAFRSDIIDMVNDFMDSGVFIE